MRRILVVAACALVVSACSSGGSTAPSSPPAPSAPTTTRPTVQEINYTTGTAAVSTTGAQQVTFTAPIDTARGATYASDDGFDVWYRNGDQALNVSGDIRSGKADVFIRVETGPGDKNAYVDSFHTICEVTVTTYSDVQLAGSFSCNDLPSWEGDTKINATGTFAASA